MRTAQTRNNRNGRRAFRLETLEGRELLSVARPLGLVAEVAKTSLVHPALIKGRVVGFQAPAGQYYQVPPGYASFSGHGSATALGYVNLGSQHVATPTNAAGTLFDLTNGSAIVTSQPGEQIFVAYTGAATVPNRAKSTFTLQGTITGGTGRFDGVTGTFTASGTVRQGHLSVNFVLTPIYPPV